MLSHVAKVVVQPGKGGQFRDLMKAQLEQVKREPGTLVYMMHVSPDDPDVFWFYEHYADEAARKAHAESEVHRHLVKQLESLAAPGTEVHWFNLVGGKGFSGAKA
jgi:quinol monooxygenase YgiN